jgi:hypothetical protein
MFAALISNPAQCFGHEQSRYSYVNLSIFHLFFPKTFAMFSFLSALGYSLFVLDEDNGSMRSLNDADAAAFNDESRSTICLIFHMTVPPATCDDAAAS